MTGQMAPHVVSLDHLVLTVADLSETVAFYEQALGMSATAFTATDGTQRWALSFGAQKINLHVAGQEFDPKSHHPTPGSADLCFLTETDLDAWQEKLSRLNIQIEEGPVQRTGAMGPILSIYIRDPDQNLIEISLPT